MSNLKDSRRNFLKIMGGFGAGILTGFSPGGKVYSSSPSEMKYDNGLRPAQALYMGDYRAPKIETVRCAFIGVGSRGSGHARQIDASGS
jgi:hypothetical protein